MDYCSFLGPASAVAWQIVMSLRDAPTDEARSVARAVGQLPIFTAAHGDCDTAAAATLIESHLKL